MIEALVIVAIIAGLLGYFVSVGLAALFLILVAVVVIVGSASGRLRL